MSQEDLPNTEFDRAKYPDNVGCNILPSVDPGLAEIELFDAEGMPQHAKVPSGAVISFNVHHLYYGLPEGTRELLKDQLGTGMVACRILERFENEELVKIALPSLEESTFLVIAKAIARKV